MLVRIDAAFEAVLGIALLLGAATGALDGSDFPRPVGTVLLLIVGLALVVLAALIWSGRVSLRALVVGNAASALAGIVWLAPLSGLSAPRAATRVRTRRRHV